MASSVQNCIDSLGIIINKIKDAKSSKDEAARFGKKCEGWVHVLRDLNERDGGLPKSADEFFAVIRDNMVRIGAIYSTEPSETLYPCPHAMANTSPRSRNISSQSSIK